MNATRSISLMLATVVLAALLLPYGRACAAEDETKLIAILTSNAPKAEKAITCKKLAIWGTKASVPALAALLPDKELHSWARIALEGMPDPAADDALRAAAGKLQGRLLIGAINSIGERRDEKAIGILIEKLKDKDAGVVSAAGWALGRIGGPKAAQALTEFLPKAPADACATVAEGCLLCADRFAAEGKKDEAIKIYELIRKANVNKQRTIEAIRGLILAKGDAGIPLLLEQVKSEDRQHRGIGLRVARELPGSKATEALMAELKNMKPQQQAFLLMALADRGDRKALPVLLNAIENGPKEAGFAAMNVMEKIGDASCLPVLAKIATSGEQTQAKAAKVALVRLLAEDVNPAIVAALPKASGKIRGLYLELVGLRRVEAAVPELCKYLSDPDAGVRLAAIKGVGAMGDGKQVPDLVAALKKTQDAKERTALESALSGTASRGGPACAAPLRELAKSDDSGLRSIALHALSCAGGPEALKTVKAALDDKDPAVQDEAARTLSTWPNQWPEDASIVEPLLTLAKQGKKETHKILALRGYLQYLRGNKKLSNDDRLAKLNDVVPLAKRPDEKRLICSVLSTIPQGAALEKLTAYAADAAIAQEACLGIVDLCKRRDLKGASKDVRKKALTIAAQKLKNRRAKKDAQGMLKGLK